MRPLQHGADIVVQSLTKTIGSGGAAIGGAVIARHDMAGRHLAAEARADYAAWLKLWPSRDSGPCMSPYSAFFFLNELRTLRIKVEWFSQNTVAVADFLARHPRVETVDYLGLKNHRLHDLAARYMRMVDSERPVFGHLLSFTVKGGPPAARRFFDGLQRIFRATDLGRIKSVATIPAISTHSQQGEEGRRLAGIPGNMVRLCVGGEHPDDIITRPGPGPGQAMNPQRWRACPPPWPDHGPDVRNAACSPPCCSAPSPFHPAAPAATRTPSPPCWKTWRRGWKKRTPRDCSPIWPEITGISRGATAPPPGPWPRNISAATAASRSSCSPRASRWETGGAATAEFDVSLYSGIGAALRKAVGFSGENYRVSCRFRREGEWRISEARWENIALRDLFPESLRILQGNFPGPLTSGVREPRSRRRRQRASTGRGDGHEKGAPCPRCILSCSSSSC